jgi:hypothetical protein
LLNELFAKHLQQTQQLVRLNNASDMSELCVLFHLCLFTRKSSPIELASGAKFAEIRNKGKIQDFSQDDLGKLILLEALKSRSVAH